MKNVLILASGNGSNFEAIIKYFKERSDINFKLLCNKKNAYVLKRAEKLNIEAYCLKFEDFSDFFKNRNACPLKRSRTQMKRRFIRDFQ